MAENHDPTERAIKARQPAYQRIAEGLRNEILGGKFKQGTQLPSTQELAEAWDTSYFTLHTALRALVKEGWVERRNGTGTYVSDLRRRFLCAGIYHGVDVGRHPDAIFLRNVHFALLEQFAHLGKDTQVFIDSRLEKDQRPLFAPLAEAIKNRRIQCLIGLSVNEFNVGALTRLPLPTAFTGGGVRNSVETDYRGMLFESVRRLRAEGCRTVGHIGVFPAWDTVHQQEFLDAVKAAGLVTRPEWTHSAADAVEKKAPFGYAEFRRLWAQPKKPDGLVISNDHIVRGAVMAIMELRVRIPDQLRLVCHRNARDPLPFPFPATWAVVDEGLFAQMLVQIVDDQFSGRKVHPAICSCSFERDNASEWK